MDKVTENQTSCVNVDEFVKESEKWDMRELGASMEHTKLAPTLVQELFKSIQIE